jgi:hypothetical protein
MKKNSLAWLIVLTLIFGISACKSYGDDGLSTTSPSVNLTDALVRESDLTGDWQWHKPQNKMPTNETVKEADQSIEIASNGLWGFWGDGNDLVIIGHTLEQYERRVPDSLTITSSDLLNIKDGEIYSPSVSQVGNSVTAQCAREPDTRPQPAIACRIIVKYSRIASILAIYAPASMSTEVEKVADQILKATDARIKQVENTIRQ